MLASKHSTIADEDGLIYKVNGTGVNGRNTLYSEDQLKFRRLRSSASKESFKFLHDNSTDYTIAIFVKSDCESRFCALLGNGHKSSSQKKGFVLGFEGHSTANGGQVWFRITNGTSSLINSKTKKGVIKKGMSSFILIEFDKSKSLRPVSIYSNNTLKEVPANSVRLENKSFSNEDPNHHVFLGGEPKSMKNGKCVNCYSNSKARSFKGHIGDVIIFKNLLTDDQKADLFDFMKVKWGIESK